jgi:hypothetical protein
MVATTALTVSAVCEGNIIAELARVTCEELAPAHEPETTQTRECPTRLVELDPEIPF